MGKYLVSPSLRLNYFRCLSCFFPHFFREKKFRAYKCRYIIPDVINCLNRGQKLGGWKKVGSRLLKRVLGKLPVEGVKGKLIPLEKENSGRIGKQSGGRFASRRRA